MGDSSPIPSGCIIQMDEKGNAKMYCPQEVTATTDPKTQTSLGHDMGEAFRIVIDPRLDEEEATWLEENIVATIFGTILSALGWMLAIYSIQVLESIVALFPILGTSAGNAIIIISLILFIVFLSFLSYRMTKALARTKILERFARKENGE